MRFLAARVIRKGKDRGCSASRVEGGEGWRGGGSVSLGRGTVVSLTNARQIRTTEAEENSGSLMSGFLAVEIN